MRASRRFEAPTWGTTLLGIVVTANLLLWMLAHPADQPWGSYIGELFGVEAVLLFSCSLVLATLLPIVERAFDGLDRVARWHRYTAVAGVVLMLAHPTLAKLTPLPDVSQFGLKLGSLAMIGLVFLKPKGRALTFEPGQFIFLAFGGTSGWERHPFTVASAPAEGRLEVSIRALGDYTRDLRENLQPGTPAKIAGPFGAFDFRRGSHEQIWIAGGVGITPFISWIRSLPDDFDREVDFYYSVNHAAEALYSDEITAAAQAHPSLRPRLIDFSVDGFLTADLAIADLTDPSQASIYMCGPPAMMTAMANGFQQIGIPRSQIRWEQFSAR